MYLRGFNIGDMVSFATYGGDIPSTVKILRGKIVELDESHVSVKAEGNTFSPADNGIVYYLDEDLCLNLIHCGFDKNQEVRQYTMDHWEQYNLVDSKDDFAALINILESHGENIESLHEAVENKEEWFCNYMDSFCAGRDLANALLSDHSFYDSWNSIYRFIQECADDENIDEFEFAATCPIQVTTDGFVICHQC